MRNYRTIIGLFVLAVFIAVPFVAYGAPKCRTERQNCTGALKGLKDAVQKGNTSVSAKAKALGKRKFLLGRNVTTESRNEYLDTSQAALLESVNALQAAEGPIAEAKAKCELYDLCLVATPTPEPTAEPTATPVP